MQIIYVNEENIEELQKSATASAMALGYFDGVHLGHQKVITKAKEKAMEHQLALAVLSFFPHPKSVLLPNYEVKYLEPIEQKAEKLAKLGVDIFYIVEFTKELAKLPPDTFLNRYVVGLQAKEISCGFDYTYGSKASGNVETLAVYAAKQQIGLTVVDEFKWNEEKISSTRIRKCLQAGKLYELPQLLGTYHTTKYCQRGGVLPYYSLPNIGDYRVLIYTSDGLIPCIATVLCKKRVQFQHDLKALPTIMTIQWVDEYDSNQTFQSYA